MRPSLGKLEEAQQLAEHAGAVRDESLKRRDEDVLAREHAREPSQLVPVDALIDVLGKEMLEKILALPAARVCDGRLAPACAKVFVESSRRPAACSLSQMSKAAPENGARPEGASERRGHRLHADGATYREASSTRAAGSSKTSS